MEVRGQMIFERVVGLADSLGLRPPRAFPDAKTSVICQTAYREQTVHVDRATSSQRSFP